MDKTKLDASIEEAKRFLKRAHTLKKKAGEDRYTFFGCKETGAVKRSSMDLSRSLADLRRSRYE